MPEVPKTGSVAPAKIEIADGDNIETSEGLAVESAHEAVIAEKGQTFIEGQRLPANMIKRMPQGPPSDTKDREGIFDPPHKELIKKKKETEAHAKRKGRGVRQKNLRGQLEDPVVGISRDTRSGFSEVIEFGMKMRDSVFALTVAA